MVRNTTYAGIVVSIFAVYAILLLLHPVLIVSDAEGCSVLGIASDCHAIDNLRYYYLNIALAVCVGVLLFSLGRWDGKRFLRINNETIRAVEDMERIIERQGQMKRRRTAYALRSMTNLLCALLLGAGMASRVSGPKTANDGALLAKSCSELRGVIQKIYHTVEISIDILDPMLLQQVEALASQIEHSAIPDLEAGKSLDYDRIRDKIKSVVELVDSHSVDVIR